MAEPIVRLSTGHFAPEKYECVKQLIDDSANPLVPAIRALRGLLYYRAAVDRETNTVLNISIWQDLAAAKQMDTLQAMLAQRPILEAAGVAFDRIVNYDPLWKIEGAWRL